MSTPETHTAHLVVCAAPPAQHLTELVSALIEDGWSLHVTATETTATWIDVTPIESLLGRPVRVTQRLPSESKSADMPNVVVVVPATFNTINKWAAGINDSAALATLQTALGEKTPILAYPYTKETLTSHPAYQKSVQLLRGCGVHFSNLTQREQANTSESQFDWNAVVTEMRTVMATCHGS